MKILGFLILASCTHDITVFDRIDDVRTARDLDILYVFDNSADRSSYDTMASQLGDLQARLAEVDGQVPNLHVGVVTADLGTRGTLDTSPGPAIGHCAADGGSGRLATFGAHLDDDYLIDLRGPTGTRVRNFDSESPDDLDGELGLLTDPAPQMVATGCEFGQPLEAMRRALDPDTNPGFIRPDAMLSIVFLTNEDDCSLKRGAMLDPSNTDLGPLSFRCTEQGVICDPDDPRRPGEHANCRPREGSELMVDVSDYEDFLAGYKADRHDVVVSAVAGPREPFSVRNLGDLTLAPSCTGPAGVAKPAVRIGSLVDSFGGVFVDGCTQDAAYQQLTSPIVDRQRSCFPQLRRDDGDNCRVIETVDDAETELEQCTDGGTAPCWYTYADAAACPDGDNVGIAIDRRASTAPAGSRIDATCFIDR